MCEVTTIFSPGKRRKRIETGQNELARTLIFLLIKNMGVEARMVVVSKVSKW